MEKLLWEGETCFAVDNISRTTYFVVFLNGNVYEKYDFMTNNMSSESGDA